MVPHFKERESRWSKEEPSRFPTGRGAFIYFTLLVSYCAFVGVASGLFPLYVGAFVLGLFVIGVLRHNARASGSPGRWRVWSVAWMLTWGALSLTLGWGSWLGYGAFLIAFVAFIRLVPQREVQTGSDGGDDVMADRGRRLITRQWAYGIAAGMVTTAVALVLAAVLLAGVELTWQSLIVAVAVIEGVGAATVVAARALLLPYGDAPDEETSLGRGLLGMSVFFLGLVWLVVSVPVAAWLTDGFNIQGPVAFIATIALVIGLGKFHDFVLRLPRRVPPRQNSRPA